MSRCKGCGKEIFWGKTSDGTNVPLDAKPPIYMFNGLTGECVRADNSFMVSHFATCPDANKFSRSKKK